MKLIDDFFKCPYTLERLHGCGYLREYLDPFADWMAERQYAAGTIRKRVSDVAHLSFSLEVAPDIRSERQSPLSIISQAGILGARVQKDTCLSREDSPR